MYLEAAVGNVSSLFEAGHAFTNFNVNVTIREKGKKVVLVNDFLGDEFDWELHVLSTGGGTGKSFLCQGL